MSRDRVRRGRAMRNRMNRWLTTLGVVLLLAGVGPAWGAATWQVVTNNDCTAFGTATGLTTAVVDCCTGSKNGFCEEKLVFGQFFERIIYFATTSAQTYTAGGDLLAAAQAAKIGLNTVIYSQCE